MSVIPQKNLLSLAISCPILWYRILYMLIFLYLLVFPTILQRWLVRFLNFYMSLRTPGYKRVCCVSIHCSYCSYAHITHLWAVRILSNELLNESDTVLLYFDSSIASWYNTLLQDYLTRFLPQTWNMLFLQGTLVPCSGKCYLRSSL